MDHTLQYIARFTRAYCEGFDKIIAGKQLYEAIEEHYGDATTLVAETQQLKDDLTSLENIRLKEQKTLADKMKLRAVETSEAEIQNWDVEILEIEGGLEQIDATILFLKAKLNASRGE
jgi:hypothetical protein